MKMLILGATGPTGRHLVDVAVRRGDSVTVLVRNPAALGDLSDRITVIKGDATSPRDVSAAMFGQNVVLSALGRGKSLFPHELFSLAADAVVGAARWHGVPRLVWMSSFGVGDTFRSATMLQKFMYSTFLRELYADKKIAEDFIRASGLDWTLVYPTGLTNGPARSRYRVGHRLQMRGAPRISRADVAAFMHHTAHNREWIRREAVITD